MKKISFKNFRTLLAGLLVAGSIIPHLPAAQAATYTPTAKVSFVFDDGPTNTYTLAAPTLAKYGFVGTSAIITGCVGMTTTPNTCAADGTVPYMTWSQISELQNTYNWEIASHSVTHPLLATATPKLTEQQVIQELTQSKSTLQANGFNAVDFVPPYGDYEPNGHPVLADVAKTYQSMRGFQDTGFNTFPYNDYLLRDQLVQGSVAVSTLKSYVDTAKANNQWLILTFHDIVPNGASTASDDYQYNQADLDQIAAYVKSLSLPVVTLSGGLINSTSNLLSNSSFDAAISSTTTDVNSWSTDDPTNIKQDTGNNGSYPSPTNSVSLKATTKDTHLFSPQVAIDSTQKYVLKNFLNVANITSGKISFYIDEYDANGVWLGGKNYAAETTKFVENINFEYVPSSVNVKKARLQVIVAANSGIQAFVDNIQWFSEDTIGTTTPVTPPAQKAGDVNGDGTVDALDLSIMLTNWSKTATRAQGDLSSDGTVDALDLSMLLTNWSK